MNKIQRQRCLRLADHLENKMTDGEYNHRFFKTMFNDGRVAYCAAGFAVANKKLFPGLKLKFSEPVEMENPEFKCCHLQDEEDPDCFPMNQLTTYFGDSAHTEVFAGWHNDKMNRKLAIETLRAIAA